MIVQFPNKPSIVVSVLVVGSGQFSGRFHLRIEGLLTFLMSTYSHEVDAHLMLFHVPKLAEVLLEEAWKNPVHSNSLKPEMVNKAQKVYGGMNAMAFQALFQQSFLEVAS